MLNRIYCADLSNKYIDNNVLVEGWVKNIRKLGSLVFIEIADITGSIQCVCDENFKHFDDILNLTKESVVKIIGTLKIRKSINKNIKNGDIEIIILDFELYSKAKTPPLIINEVTDALEEVRYQYRYLDLRRPNIQQIFIFRSKLVQLIHQFFISEKFLYIETPILAKPTPEGARDYLVPSRIKHKSFYALPQSPQIYKQLLMVSGYEKYYQIAKCFRDEDLRSDRQPEFTQLDIELSFCDEQTIQCLTEKLLKYLFKELLSIDITTPFIRMDYDYAMLHYGCDKPDIRFENLIYDFNDIFNQNQNEHEILINQNQTIRAIGFEYDVSRKLIDNLDDLLKKSSHKNSLYVKKKDNIYSGNLAKKINSKLLDIIFSKLNIKNGIVFFNIDDIKTCSIPLSIVRNYLANELKIIDFNAYKLLWIVNWPLFEYNNNENRYYAAHHPFTQPAIINHDNFYADKENARARSYDVVLNGVELGGGSIRINDINMQLKMFEVLNISKQEAYDKFSTILEAFEYGVPPHGGIAIGIDRFIQLLLNLSSIKECIAFPKNNKAYDPAIKTPSDISDDQLAELNLSYKEK